MIQETQCPDGSWLYEGDGRTETIGTSRDGRYTHQVIHCGWAQVEKRLSDADFKKIFGEEECCRQVLPGEIV
jgi:hypothetical protein